MKLSIIIPTYNSASTLRRALNSIVCQTFTDWEVLIMDGLSTDDTLEIAQSYNDSRIHIYSEPDKGIYDAMNKGIKRAVGKWLYFIGCDDWLLASNTLESIFSMDINKYDIIYGDVEAEHLAPEHSGEWSLAAIDYNRCHQCIFYRKEVFKKVGMYNLSYPVFADFDLNLKWFFSKRLKHQYVPITVAHYSEGGYSSRQKDTLFYEKLPYLKLLRGRHQFSRHEKIGFINESLNSKAIRFHTKIFIFVWKKKMEVMNALKTFFRHRNLL